MAHSRLFAFLVLALTLAGCATTRALRDGRQAEFLQEYDRAIVEYTKVLREDPDNRDARQGLERMRLRSSLEHFSRGRRLAQTARLEEALVESLIERMRSMPPPGLDLPEVQMPETLMWSGSARDLYSFLGKTANISVAFD